MNTILFIEQSYIDSNMSKFLTRYYNINYNLSYSNTSYDLIPGNVGSFVGDFSEKEFVKQTPNIIKDLQKYGSFFKFLGCYYKGYWLLKTHINTINSKEFEDNYKLINTCYYYNTTQQINQALNEGFIKLILIIQLPK